MFTLPVKIKTLQWWSGVFFTVLFFKFVFLISFLDLFLSSSRVQPRLLPLPPGLCEVLPPRLHVRPTTAQPLPGKLGGLVLCSGLPVLPPILPHLLRLWIYRLPFLSNSQPPSLHRLPAPEPGPEEIPPYWRTAGWRRWAGGEDTSSSSGGRRHEQRINWRTARTQCCAALSASCRRGGSQLCLDPGCLRWGLLLASGALRRHRFDLEDQTALCVFRHQEDSAGPWLGLPAGAGEEGSDMLQGDPHCVGGRGHHRLWVWIRQRGSGRSEREDSFYQDAELDVAGSASVAAVSHTVARRVWDLTVQRWYMKEKHRPYCPISTTS